ncbi:DUF6292 family protein [Actinomadura sp. 7K507]|uniref:DUF6292 family protein n=1 Tax=Actinomadura sp. 7K507 TaxID=2530365 RepID=UPI00104942DB|nr:DUF6292 family protein [Actinomadura sp. 7K507]TDC76959.1 hypothetical protein E1285_39325 [Actinomadura sp. 7K507]
MSVSTVPAHHPDREVDCSHGYITDTAQKLAARGIPVRDAWLDPKGPIDATIVIGESALVWDEWTGWRIGTYMSGRQGVRTVLGDARQLGGGVLDLWLTRHLPAGATSPLT